MGSLVKSCSDCKTKCCKTGPGPYKTLSADEYLGNFGNTDSYNTRCVNLTRSGKCRAWRTREFPVECRIYVCQTRSFTKKELHIIDNVVDLSEFNARCPNCSVEWCVEREDEFLDCEVCGITWNWEHRVIYRKGAK